MNMSAIFAANIFLLIAIIILAIIKQSKNSAVCRVFE